MYKHEGKIAEITPNGQVASFEMTTTKGQYGGPLVT